VAIFKGFVEVTSGGVTSPPSVVQLHGFGTGPIPKGFPAKSSAVVTVNVYKVETAKLLWEHVTIVSPPLHAHDQPPGSGRIVNANVIVLIDSLKVMITSWFTATPVSESAGSVETIMGDVVSGALVIGAYIRNPNNPELTRIVRIKYGGKLLLPTPPLASVFISPALKYTSVTSIKKNLNAF
jgi:hypothetical protein